MQKKKTALTQFLLTCLLRGMTKQLVDMLPKTIVSTHMPLARHDPWLLTQNITQNMFLLTCLLRGMTVIFNYHVVLDKFLLTCLLRGMTFLLLKNIKYSEVSTHMPLARHDSNVSITSVEHIVSTHMPLARHDGTSSHLLHQCSCFYSHASCEA